MPDITTVAELEFYGLSKSAMQVLDKMDIVYLDDLEHVTAEQIRAEPWGGPKSLQNIRETLRNYKAGRKTVTLTQAMFPNERR